MVGFRGSVTGLCVLATLLSFNARAQSPSSQFLSLAPNAVEAPALPQNQNGTSFSFVEKNSPAGLAQALRNVPRSITYPEGSKRESITCYSWHPHHGTLWLPPNGSIVRAGLHQDIGSERNSFLYMEFVPVRDFAESYEWALANKDITISEFERTFDGEVAQRFEHYTNIGLRNEAAYYRALEDFSRNHNIRAFQDINADSLRGNLIREREATFEDIKDRYLRFAKGISLETADDFALFLYLSVIPPVVDNLNPSHCFRIPYLEVSQQTP